MTSDGSGGPVPYGRAVRFCGWFAAGLGLLALIGWSAGVLVLAGGLPDRCPMAPSSALLFILYGSAVAVRARVPLRRGSYWFGAAVHGAGALVALLLLAYARRGIYPDIEHLGFAAEGLVDGVPIGHMSAATALGFIVAALSFLASLPSVPALRRWRGIAAWYFACLLLLGFSLLLLAYLYGTPLMYGGGLVPPSMTSCIAFVALGVALSALSGPQVWSRGETTAETARGESVLLLVFIVTSAGVIVAGYLYFRAYQVHYRADVVRHLDSIAEVKVSELAQYRRERLGDGSVFFGNTAFSALVERVLDNPADALSRAELRVWLDKQQTDRQYDQTVLLDELGVEVMSVPESATPVASLVASKAAAVLRSKEVVIEDFYSDEHDQRVHLAVLVPIVGGRDGGRALGVLILRIDPAAYLYPLIRRWPTPSETAETLLARRDGDDVLFLNEVRFRPDSAMSLRVPLTKRDMPAVKAVSGQQGIVEGVDYRGERVIADLHAVPDSPWFLIARMDTAEAFAPLRERMWLTVVLVGVLLIGGGATAWGAWRQQRSRFYREKYQAERGRAWLQHLIERSLNEIYVFDPETLRFSFANAGACRNVGYTAEELHGLTPLDIKPEFTEETFRGLVEPLRTGEREVLVFDTVHLRKDGSEYPVEVHLQFVDTGDARAFLAVINDITERKTAEAVLSDREKRLAAIVASIPGLVSQVDSNLICRFASAGYERAFGIAPERIVGLSMRDVLGDEGFARVEAYARRALMGERVTFENHVQTPSGVVTYGLVTYVPNAAADGKIEGFFIIAIDITERKRAEAALQRQRDLYDMLAQTSQEIVRCQNREELFVALCRIAVEHGRFASAWVGLRDDDEGRVLPVVSYGDHGGYIRDLHISADASTADGRGPTGLAFHTGRSAVSNDFLNDPEMAPWHQAARRAGIHACAAFPLRERGIVVRSLTLYAGEPGRFTADVLATLDEMVNDVSFALDRFALGRDHARAEEALRESEDRYRDLVENSQDLICTHDMEGFLLSVNEAAVRMSGHSREVLLRMNMVDLVDPGFREQFPGYLAELRDRGRAGGIMRVRSATGETRIWEFENTVRVQGGAGPIVRGMAHDITDRLSGERQRRVLEGQLRAAQKMEALGTLAGGIAHDFNNILSAVIGNVELARQDVGPSHPAIESLEEVLKASRRAKDLVKRILAFGSRQQQPQSVILPRPVVEEGVALLRAILPAGIELRTALDPDTPAVLADPTDIHQVLINLCTNAWQALGGMTGRVDIALDAVTLDDDAVRTDADLRPGRYACLSVTDAGSGMDAATLERMFEPFFTTKSVGQGTGLGLSVVHGIVKAHNGFIAVRSRLGEGTTFRVYFPAVETPAPEAGAETTVGEPVAAAGGRHVLYVDDEEALVFLVTRTLERMGYRVSGFTRAAEAIAAVRASPSQFDLVVTDQNMPGLCGLEVARELARMRPDLPVVLASGYITEELRVQAIEAGVREMIYKPNTVEELCAVVLRTVGASAARSD